jgi:uncharacterized membrane protein
MDPRTLMLALYLCVGGVLCLISAPLILGMIGPNPFYGLRVKRTLDDPAVWYPANRIAAWWMLAAGVLVMLVAALAYLLLPRLGLVPYAFTCLGTLIVSLTLGLLQAFRYLRRL